MERSHKIALTIIAALTVSFPAHGGDAMYQPAMNYGQSYMQQRGLYSVELNKTELLRLGGQAGAVIVGNPAIADVSVHASDTLLVIGRGYGETNLIILDKAGQIMIDADIQVIGPNLRQGVRIFNGSSRSTYSCAPQCLPAPIMGDDPSFVASYSGKTTNAQNTSALGASTSGYSHSTSSNPDDTMSLQMDDN